MKTGEGPLEPFEMRDLLTLVTDRICDLERRGHDGSTDKYYALQCRLGALLREHEARLDKALRRYRPKGAIADFDRTVSSILQ